MARIRPQAVCVCCGRNGTANARGLINGCYARWRHQKRLHEFPTQRYRFRDTLLDRWQQLARNPPEALRLWEAARMLDMTPAALQRALCRARKAGDERAIYLPHPFTGVRYDPTRRRNR